MCVLLGVNTMLAVTLQSVANQAHLVLVNVYIGFEIFRCFKQCKLCISVHYDDASYVTTVASCM